jgi:hypothetical protein
VAVELDPAGARQLAESILAMLDAAPPGLVEESLRAERPPGAA